MARSTHTLGLLTLSLLASTAIVQPARADTAQSRSDWTVNKVASAASGSYCTMAQKYSDDTILTFARNQGGEYSLAFDFLKPQFPDATSATVSLRPGNGSAQTFSVSPVSDKVIVINLGTNPSFVNAVKASGKIDLESGGKVHSFAPGKFASAADELSSCVGTMKAPAMAAAKPQSQPAQAPETPMADNATITASLAPAAGEPTIVSAPDMKNIQPMSATTQQVASLTAENAQLRQALAESRKNFEAAQKNSQTAMTSELQEKLQSVQKENETLKSQKPVPQAPDLSRELADLQKTNADMKAQLKAANQTVGQLQARMVQSSNAGDQLALLQKQNADMKTQLDTATITVSQLQTKSAESAAASSQLAGLQKQAADMKAQLDAANQNVAQLQSKTAQSDAAAQQMGLLQKQSADMKIQLDAANQNVAQLQAKNIQASSAADKLAALQRENADMKVQMATAAQTISALQAKTEQSGAAAEQIALLQKQNADIKTQLDASNQTAAQLQNKAPIVDPKLAEENAALKQQIAALQTSPATSSADKQQLTILASENAALKQQLANKATPPATKNMANEAVKNIQAQLDAVIAERDALKAQVASGPVAGDKQQLSTLVSENAALKQQLAAKAEPSSGNGNLQTQLDATIAERDALKTQIAAGPVAAPVSAQDKQQMAALASENAALKQQLAEKTTTTASAQSDTQAMNDMQADLKSALAERDVLKTQITAMTNGDGKSAATGSNWDLEQATKRYQESQREIQRLSSKIQEQQVEFEKQKKDLQAMLFDPAVTERAQLDRLNELEQKVADLQAGRPVSMETASAPMAPISAMAVPVPQVTKAPERVADIAPAAGTPQNERQSLDPIIEKKKIIAPKSAVASAVISPIASVKFQSQDDFARMIGAAGINIRGTVEPVASGSPDSYRAYRWKTDSLYGSVEQRAMKGGKSFDAAVNEYLDRAKSRCAGDFAAVPSEVSVSAEKAKSFEIACLGGKENTSASVLFTYGNDVMSTLAHEGKSEAMDLAMEARDRMAAQMGDVMKTASK